MPAARGLKRTASKAEAKPVAGSSKIKKKPEAKVPLFNGDLVGPTKKGQVFTTGQGDVGQLGLGEEHLERSRFTHVKDLPSNIVDICAGGMHSVAIDKDGNVWTFGCNDEGALGRDTEEAGSEFTPRKVVLPGRAVAVSAGDSHSAALLHTFQVFAWGSFRDSHGNMGLTLKGNERTPIEMLPGQRVVQIASGGDHLVMLTDQGQVFTCGCGEQGQLGRVTARSCDRHSRLGLNGLLVPAPLVFCRDKADFDHIWAGTHCTFARKALRHDIYVWGLNNYQQIGVRKGSPQTVFAPVVAEAFKGAAWSKIAGGPHHSLALDEEGVCHALGRREYGRLGLGDSSEDAKELTAVPALKEKKCISISCGSAASFAVTDAGEIHVWGMGSSGQLGTGGEDDEAEPKLLATGKLEGRHCIRVSAGGQHTVLLVATEDEGEDEVPEPEKAVTAPKTKVEETPMETEEAQEEDEKEEPKKEDKKAEKKAKADAKAEAKAAEAKAKEEKKEPRKAPAKRGRKASTASVEAKPAAVPMEDDTDAATAEAPSTAPAAESVSSAALPAVPEVPSESQDLPSVPEQTSSPATEDEAKEAEEPKAESGAALPTPEKIETPVATETTIAKETPIAKEIPIVSETTNAIETPIASETKETPIASESTNAKETEITSETTNAKETPVTTTETPMEINNGSEEKIPEKEAAITNEPTVSEPTITTEKRERAGDDDNAEEPACKRARTELANGSARPMEGLSS